jgi:hypothetical protein
MGPRQRAKPLTLLEIFGTPTAAWLAQLRGGLVMRAPGSSWPDHWQSYV